jgi:PAS domain S-box-containing protein
MDNSPALNWMKNESGSYVYVNRAFERVFGFSRDQVIGKTDRERWAPDIAVRIEENDRKLLASGQGLEVLESMPAADGSLHQWNVHRFAILEDTNGRLIGGIALDMTEKLRLAERLRQSQRMEAVGRLAGGIAHDFNNLMATVTGYAELLLPRLPENEPSHRYASEIAKSAERAASLTRQLLAYTSQQMLQPKILDLNAILTEKETDLRGLVGGAIDLDLVRHAQLREVLADPDQIEQVILNLVLNARDAMPNGGHLTIETTNVEIGPGAVGLDVPHLPGAYVLLTVSDTGHGMDAETKAKIFEPFFTTKGMGKGTGLGLSTVHGIVHQSGGHMAVYSEVNVGTTFKVYLPVNAEVGVASGDAGLAVGPNGGPEVVLLVDDEEGIRNLASDVLKGHGFEVIEACHGEDAIEIAARYLGRIDALVTDVVMTGMSGRQLADQLCGTRPNIKVLFMSGYPGNAAVRHGLLQPGNEFIQKPFMPDKLAAKLREMLDGQRVV